MYLLLTYLLTLRSLQVVMHARCTPTTQSTPLRSLQHVSRTHSRMPIAPQGGPCPTTRHFMHVFESACCGVPFRASSNSSAGHGSLRLKQPPRPGPNTSPITLHL